MNTLIICYLVSMLLCKLLNIDATSSLQYSIAYWVGSLLVDTFINKG